MNTLTRAENMAKFKEQVAAGKILVGVGAGTGITAKSSEAGGADMLIIYNSGRYRMAGRGSLAGLLSYGDANQIVVEMGAEVLPVVKHTPVLAGVCGTDPFRVMEIYLKQLKEQGFNGVQNFPTVGLIDGVFRQNLEETGMGYGLEVDMIRKAHELDMLTCPYVFDPDQARAMAEAGANPIYCVWDDLATEAVKLAAEFPDTKFINVDCYVTGEDANIKTIVVEPQQATFIAGVVAANSTETGKVGWLGSMDNPVINKFREGFEAGVAYVDNGTTCESLYIGDANDPNKGTELAKQVIGKGADIVMHSANQSGLGVIRACEEEGVKAIGVDEWQGALNEEVVFWSALKDITGAVYEAGKSVMEDTFEPGMSVHDSSTGAALYDERDYNKLSDDLKAIVDDVVAKLASGEIVIETAE